MAQLTADPLLASGARLRWSQFGAIAWLRWRILVNGWRRKGGAGELIGRILLLPVVAALVLGPACAAGFFAWYLASSNGLHTLPFVFWAVFVLTQLFNINLGQPGTTFDPTELIRFPMALHSFILVRLCFGLFTPANAVVTLASLAVFIGVTLALPQLWLFTLAATAAFALANVLFTRMVFAWIDRWLSTRRAREIFTALIFAASLGFQYLNVNYNPGFRNNKARSVTPEHLHRAQLFLAHLHPILRWLPPELAGSGIQLAAGGNVSRSLASTALILGYALVFLLIYALRMRTEYHGENLSDAANAVRPAKIATSHISTATSGALPVLDEANTASAPPRSGLLPPILIPLVRKEILVLRRNVGLLYGVVAPMVMVFLFAGRISTRGGAHWPLLIAVSYALLGLAPMSYNSFGLEGTGAQFYFIAPVPLRDVFLAKNTVQFLLAAIDVALVLAALAHLVGVPAFSDVLFALLWAAATLLVNTSVGNLRSISAPKKLNPGRTINRAQSQVSAWIAIGIFVVCAGVGAGLQLLAQFLQRPWLSPLVMALLAGVAGFAYAQGLRGIDAYAMARRETLFEELGKKV